ncbi:MAG TPA: hypothetical protein VFD02_05170 [Syntrophomonadaceae bacterium]|nr:hypothetical protein [Syntrophomonadaceae bacterium]
MASATTNKTKEVEAFICEEISTFLNTAENERLYAACLLAVTSGLCRGELLGLKLTSKILKLQRAGELFPQSQLWSKGKIKGLPT